MGKNVLSFLLALQLLTRIPVAYSFDTGSKEFTSLCGRSVLFYPLVGLLIGGILYLSTLLLSPLFSGNYSELIVAVFILLIWVLITGGLHLDGLADSADAWLGGLGDSNRSLEIMKDPRCGVAGVVSLVFVLMLKLVLISAILSRHENTSLLILAISPVLARAFIPALFLFTPYARKEGMGIIPSKHMPVVAAKLELILISLLCVLFINNGFTIIISTIIVFYLLRRLMMSRIGGFTGDTTGATVEIIECTVLLHAVL